MFPAAGGKHTAATGERGRDAAPPPSIPSEGAIWTLRAVRTTVGSTVSGVTRPATRWTGGGGIVGVRGIVLALVVLALLGLGLARATAEDSVPPGACVSAVGPVDADGNGETTAVRAGDCP